MHPWGERRKPFAHCRSLPELSRLIRVDPGAFATVHTALGDKDRAFEWLAKGLDDRPSTVMRITVDHELEAIFHILDAALSFLVITALFAAIYKVIPDVRSEWRDVILGGAVTSGLFTGGKVLLGLYLGKASFASTYGAAGSLVVFMIWVYYSSQIFFLGAEFTKIFATRYGSQPTLHPEGMIVSASNVDIHPDTTIIKPV
jgi:hypothetical protein